MCFSIYSNDCGATHYLKKEKLSLCQKLRVSNTYFFATQRGIDLSCFKLSSKLVYIYIEGLHNHFAKI